MGSGQLSMYCIVLYCIVLYKENLYFFIVFLLTYSVFIALLSFSRIKTLENH